jgi:16S rRNA (cytidine1402-2'-O)-methyltransferase
MLYVVATPIGNLEDITLRALRVLREVDLIAAEDTRQTRKLLSRYDIETELTSYHEHNERSKAVQLVDRLESGENIAIVSDAGTPTISDPGYHVVRNAIQRGIPVTSIPGPSAAIAALSVSGLPTDRFTFDGFLPSKRSRRRQVLVQHKAEEGTMVYYEAPHRIKDTLTDMVEILGDRQVVVARELTKMHEEFFRGPLSQVVAEVTGREMRGEFVIIVAGCPENSEFNEDQLILEVERLQRSGLKASEIVKALAQFYPIPKRDVYKRVLQLMSQSAWSEDS